MSGATLSMLVDVACVAALLCALASIGRSCGRRRVAPALDQVVPIATTAGLTAFHLGDLLLNPKVHGATASTALLHLSACLTILLLARRLP